MNLKNKMVCVYPGFLLIFYFFNTCYILSFDRKLNHECCTQIIISRNNFIRCEEISSYNPIIIAKVISNMHRLAMHTQNNKKIMLNPRIFMKYKYCSPFAVSNISCRWNHQEITARRWISVFWNYSCSSKRCVGWCRREVHAA